MLDDIIGQSALKASLTVAIGAARNTGTALGHLMLSGPGGTGKTHILMAVAKELGKEPVVTQGNRLTASKVSKFLIENLIESNHDFLIIDEIHEMTPEAQDELFYPMDVDNPRVLTLQDPIKLPSFTLAAATTDLEAIDDKSLVKRFKYHWHLQDMEPDELLIVVSQYLSKEGVDASFPSIYQISARSRGVPRLALKYASRAVDFARFHDRGYLTDFDVEQMFAELGIDDLGLDKNQRQYLTILYRSDKPMGKEALASTMGNWSAEQVVKLIEPYLWKMGLITSSNKGRELTEAGHKHIMATCGLSGEL